MTIVYHNPKCRKSRAGLGYVKTRCNEPIVKEYIREGISVSELKDLVALLGLKPYDLVRTQEDYFKEHLKGKELTDEEWLNVLSENPRLIKRPIVVHNQQAVIADPATNVETIL